MGKITVFGGEQMRPNIHIRDITDLYVQALQWPENVIDGKIFNAGIENQSVQKVAAIVRDVLGEDVRLITTTTGDNRSYHVSSKKIEDELGFEARYSIRQAVEDIRDAFEQGRLPNSLTDEKYFNIKRMQSLKLA
jgi:nucleoside-diphosphate-sugar epimerase